MDNLIIDPRKNFMKYIRFGYISVQNELMSQYSSLSSAASLLLVINFLWALANFSCTFCSWSWLRCGYFTFNLSGHQSERFFYVHGFLGWSLKEPDIKMISKLFSFLIALKTWNCWVLYFMLAVWYCLKYAVSLQISKNILALCSFLFTRVSMRASLSIFCFLVLYLR